VKYIVGVVIMLDDIIDKIFKRPKNEGATAVPDDEPEERSSVRCDGCGTSMWGTQTMLDTTAVSVDSERLYLCRGCKDILRIVNKPAHARFLATVYPCSVNIENIDAVHTGGESGWDVYTTYEEHLGGYVRNVFAFCDERNLVYRNATGACRNETDRILSEIAGHISFIRKIDLRFPPNITDKQFEDFINDSSKNYHDEVLMLGDKVGLYKNLYNLHIKCSPIQVADRPYQCKLWKYGNGELNGEKKV
jgi:hypothetical protein